MVMGLGFMEKKYFCLPLYIVLRDIFACMFVCFFLLLLNKLFYFGRREIKKYISDFLREKE